MKNTQKVILGVIGIIIITVIGVWGFLPAGRQGSQNNAPAVNSSVKNTNINTANIELRDVPQIGKLTNQNTNQISLQIDRQDGSTVNVFSVKIEKDLTVLEQLQKAAVDNNIAIEIKTESFGSYVDSLDGLKGGTDGKYWMYSVNGKTAEVGADQYKLAEGDVVEWKFTK